MDDDVDYIVISVCLLPEESRASLTIMFPDSGDQARFVGQVQLDYTGVGLMQEVLA